MNLLITGAWGDAQKYIKEIGEMGHQIFFMQWEKDELPVEASWVEGVICNGLFLHHDISLFTNLKYVQLTSTGFDRIDLQYIREHDIAIYNAKGVYSIPMAEYAIAGVMSIYKQLDTLREQQIRRKWEKIRNIRELSGKCVVIVGCGDVGRECAKRFKAFGCSVIGINRNVREMEEFDAVLGLECLDDKLRTADVVIVSIAYTEATKKIVKAKYLQPDAVLVNISRGATVDLNDAQCHLILDVFESEPLPESDQLWESDIITPHNSYVGEQNGKRLYDVIKQNLNRASR